MDKLSIARFITLIVGLLAYFGVNVPSNVEEAIVGIIVGVIAIYTAYKNNDFTKEAKAGTNHMKKLKQRNKNK